MTAPLSDALVFFGATGDLAYKKIFPALQSMVKRGTLHVPVVGVAKAGWNLDETIARRVVSGVARAVHEIRSDQGHALRRQFDAYVARFVEQLKRDPATRAKINALRDELVANPALGKRSIDRRSTSTGMGAAP